MARTGGNDINARRGETISSHCRWARWKDPDTGAQRQGSREEAMAALHALPPSRRRLMLRTLRWSLFAPPPNDSVGCRGSNNRKGPEGGTP